MTDEPMVERLEALEAAATPGPWESFVDFGNQESHVRTPKWSVSLGLAARTADTELIVAMRNDLPALLSQLREQRERADREERIRLALGVDKGHLENTVREQREALESIVKFSTDPLAAATARAALASLPPVADERTTE